MSQRTTRSRSRAETRTPSPQSIDHNARQSPDPVTTFQVPHRVSSMVAKPIGLLPSTLTRKQTRLCQRSHALLLQKQRLLRALDLPFTHADQKHFVGRSKLVRVDRRAPLQQAEQVKVSNAVSSTLILAEESAGTAVCIHESGLILTCAHCVAESREELEQDHNAKKWKPLWLLTAAGNIVLARCIAWDGKRDLALLTVVSAQSVYEGVDRAGVEGIVSSACESHPRFTCLRVSLSMPTLNTRVSCIGQPGGEDLEAAVEGVKTDYPLLVVSHGRFLGYAKDQDIEDNSEIGALCHNAWTYWGHSGAPIVDLQGARCDLVGLHSSWDDQTGTRRGVGVEAIQGFFNAVNETLSTGKDNGVFIDGEQLGQ